MHSLLGNKSPYQQVHRSHESLGASIRQKIEGKASNGRKFGYASLSKWSPISEILEQPENPDSLVYSSSGVIAVDILEQYSLI